MQRRGGGHGLEAGGADRLPADLAQAVGPVLQALDGGLHLVEGLLQLGGQALGLAPLGRHLAGVGEVGVVVEAAPLVGEPELRQLGLQAGLLGAQEGGKIDVGGLRRWGLVRHGVMLRGPSPSLFPPAGGRPRRHGARCSAETLV